MSLGPGNRRGGAEGEITRLGTRAFGSLRANLPGLQSPRWVVKAFFFFFLNTSFEPSHPSSLMCLHFKQKVEPGVALIILGLAVLLWMGILLVLMQAWGAIQNSCPSLHQFFTVLS